MSAPIPWREWEEEAHRLHRAIQAGRPAATGLTLSGAKQLVARMLGWAHWHELEQRVLPKGTRKREGR